MASELDRITRIEIQLALEELNTSFCHYLDHGNIDALVDLFTPDAKYSHGPLQSSTQDEIRELFTKRAETGVRTSRHIYSGLKLNIINEYEASGSSVCMTFVEDASPPISHVNPYLVADFLDEYRYCDDARWRISKRHIERIFVGSKNKIPVGYIEPDNNN